MKKSHIVTKVGLNLSESSLILTFGRELVHLDHQLPLFVERYGRASVFVKSRGHEDPHGSFDLPIARVDYRYVVVVGVVVEMSYSGRNGTAWHEIQSVGQIDVALVPVGIEGVWICTWRADAHVRDGYTAKSQLK